jgi:hypothetical protein
LHIGETCLPAAFYGRKTAVFYILIEFLFAISVFHPRRMKYASRVENEDFCSKSDEPLAASLKKRARNGFLARFAAQNA